MQLVKKMFEVFVCLCFVISNGVFGADEVKSVSVMEGHSVTLQTDLTELQRYQIEWIEESQGALMAQINTQAKSSFICDSYDERFRVKLKLENKTGSLTITNISIIQSGLYKQKITGNNGTSYRRFNVTVYARLPVPVITRNSSQCSSSSSNCSVLCSVMNVTHDVSLSWYNGSRVHSSVSGSDLNITLSLPLEVEYQDNSTYRCVVKNPITNQTRHLTDVYKCSEHNVAVIVAVVVTVLCLLGVIAGFIHQRKRITQLQ